jgi:uncharacterized protein YgbK (DUF1537 family)
MRGIKTMLFVDPPDEEMLRRYPDVRAIGVAGNSRTMSPSVMDAHLTGAFQALQQLRPKFVHYKVCSTFDSSPEIGSIGRAIDIGHRVFQNQVIPLVVAAPALQRFCVFGNLFARSGLDSPVFRLDRHPTMRQHPVTPMDEADLRTHLSRQTTRPIELVDVLTLENGYDSVADRLREIARTRGSVALFDTLTEAHLATIGRLLATMQEDQRQTLFVVGSSGIGHALGNYWQSTIPTSVTACEGRSSSEIEPVDRTLVVSGSCSPVTDRQIAWALENGFAEVAVDSPAIIQAQRIEAEALQVAKKARSALDSGRSVIVHAGGRSLDRRPDGAPSDRRADPSVLGSLLGQVLRGAVRTRSVRRAAVVGGDTSGVVAGSLGIDALEFAGPLEPGAPLCIARSRDPDVDGLEIVFKGGQVGYDNFFNTVRCGQSARSPIGALK